MAKSKKRKGVEAKQRKQKAHNKLMNRHDNIKTLKKLISDAQEKQAEKEERAKFLSQYGDPTKILEQSNI